MGVMFWITDLVAPATLMVLGLFYKFRPPREINRISGYRTSRSMRSQQAWDYAQKRVADTFPLLGGVLLLLIALDKAFLPVPQEYLSLGNVGLVFAALLFLIVKIELELKKKFDA